MTYSVNTDQPPSPAATPVVVQWTQEQSGHGGKEGGYTWTQQHGFPLPKASLAIATTGHSTETKTESLIQHHSRGDQLTTWWQVDYIWTTSTMEGEELCSS